MNQIVRMNRGRLLFLSILICLAGSSRVALSQAGMQATATGQIFAEVISVWTAEETAPLNFGKFAPGPYGGEIIVSPESTLSLLGSVYKGTGAHSAGRFYVTGEDDAAFSVSLPEGPVPITHVSSARTMVVDNWQSVPEQGNATGVLQGGAKVVYVGATLKMGSLQDNPPGIYTGSYTITFDFN